MNQQEKQIEEKPKVVIKEKAVETTDSKSEHEKRVKELLGN